MAEHEFCIASSDSSGAAPLDIIANIAQLQVARQEADLVFFSIHGGNGHYPLPRPKLRDTCRFLIDQGADGVFCHHAHIPGAYEIYKNKPISYSLGNLVFGVGGKKRGSAWSEGYLFEAEFSVSSKQMTEYRLIPYRQYAGQGGARKLEGAEQSDFLERIKRLNEIVSSDEKLLDEWRMFCEKKSRSVIMEYFLPFRFRGIGILSRLFSLNSLLLGSKKARLAKLNTIRCQSQRDLFIAILENATSE